MIHAVIMAGGQGERFWPLSRRKHPKQLIRIVGKEVMLQETVARLKPLVKESEIWIVTNTEQAGAIRELLPRVPSEQILEEPAGRNTAPCIALAAYSIRKRDPEAMMIVLPSDHIISPKIKFHRALRACCRQAARESYLITIGIKPDYPATGYGYIKRKAKNLSRGKRPFFPVEKFTEKPDHDRARKFIRSRYYSWNSGIFVWSAGTIIAALQEYLPEISRPLEPLLTLPFRRRKAFLRKVYPRLPAISIDYGIMEKHPRVLVTLADFSWDDLGSWDSLFKYYPADSDRNRSRGKSVMVDSSNCLTLSSGPLVGLVGVSNLIVVVTEDAVLVSSRRQAQEVKKLVQRMRRGRRYRKYL